MDPLKPMSKFPLTLTGPGRKLSCWLESRDGFDENPNTKVY